MNFFILKQDYLNNYQKSSINYIYIFYNSSCGNNLITFDFSMYLIDCNNRHVWEKL